MAFECRLTGLYQVPPFITHRQVPQTNELDSC